MSIQSETWDIIKGLTKPEIIPINYCPKCSSKLAVIARVDEEFFYCISCDQDWIIKPRDNRTINHDALHPG